MAKKVERKKTSKKTKEWGSSLLAESYELSDLEQVKILADPLRVKLLKSFCQERTTKQVAELLGEKSTKLYHHVEALQKVGLIRLARTRQNRGTLEKYYLAVARTFRVAPSLFPDADSESPDKDVLPNMLQKMFDQVSSELLALGSAGYDKRLEEQGIITFCELQAPEADIRKLHRRLDRLVASLLKEGSGKKVETSENDRRFRLMLAFFPMDLKDK